MNQGPLVGAAIALKPLRQAKTRLDLVPPLRERIALCMFLDTVSALTAAVDRTVVVSDQPGLQAQLDRLGIDAVVIPDGDGGGLNPALRRAEQWLRTTGTSRIIACVGDLPCLSAEAVGAVLARFDTLEVPRAFVPDATGSGTTMLLTAGPPLDPRFQGLSAAAHVGTGAVELTSDPEAGGTAELQVWRRARRDVDSETDLRQAAEVGLGSWTSTLIDPDTGAPGHYTTVTVTGAAGSNGDLDVVTADRVRLTLAPTTIRSPSDHLPARERLHAVRTGTRILTAW